MNEDQKNITRKFTGNHYSEFSLDEFKHHYTIEGLCKAIRTDDYKIKFYKSSDNSIGRLNEILESIELCEILVEKQGDRNWSFDVKYLFSVTSKIRDKKNLFSELNDDEQTKIMRLNRLLIEETYPQNAPKSAKYFIPPGLKYYVDVFEDHYKIAKGEPILIIGQTGVGKSLFLHIFEKLYRIDHKEGNTHPIVKANCAHFGGDPNLVRSELFGHMAGSFTGAIADKKGLVEMANGGVLILEEIGDLPLESQAMLLTFIETGEYYRIGDGMNKRSKKIQNRSGFTSDMESVNDLNTDSEKIGMGKPRSANVQIIGLTNREDCLREDFKNRFFPFYVPPIYKRRNDILYYFIAGFPDLFPAMTPYETLTLMAYNWPGNVREIERIGLLLRRGREDMKRMRFSSEQEKTSFEKGRLFRLINALGGITNETPLAFKGEILHLSLTDIGIDVEFLESIMNKYRVGLSNFTECSFFDDIHYLAINTNLSERYGLRYTYKINWLEEAYKGLEVFCEIFCQHPMSDGNLFDLPKFVPSNPMNEVKYPKNQKAKFKKLIESIFDYVQKNNKDIEYSNKCESEEVDIFSLNIDDYLKIYYQTILDRAQGNQTKASQLAGMKLTTFRDKLKKYDILGEKNKLRFKITS